MAAAVFATFAWLLWQFCDRMAALPTAGQRANALVWAGVLACAAWLIQDVFSGLAHWVLDNYVTAHTPLLGPLGVEFQLHHAQPDKLHEDSFWSVTLPLGRILCPPALLAAASRPGVGALAFWMSWLLFGWLGQAFHRWAHAPRAGAAVPGVARLLRALRIAQPPAEHLEAHHRMPWSRSYCIVSGINNRWLDGFDVFPKLEYIAFRLTGLRPNTWKHPGLAAIAQAQFRGAAARHAARLAFQEQRRHHDKTFAAQARATFERLGIDSGLSGPADAGPARAPRSDPTGHRTAG